MKNILNDLSGKIDEVRVAAFFRVHQVLSSLGTPFFVVGATARDVLLDLSHGIGSKRATLDIDIAVFIESWDQFEQIKDELIRTSDFLPARESQRLIFREQLPVDIVPFGGIAEKGDVVFWPPDRSFKMSITGFQECYLHAVQVKVADEPELTIKVVNLAGLTMLKLISWDETSERRQKDATDIFFIIQNYLDAGNMERLFEEASDIIESGRRNYEAGSARLLGRDIAAMAFATTTARLIEILERESQRERGHRLVIDVLQARSFVEKSYEEIFDLFEALLAGMKDHANQ